jgi:hypothetical protein
VQDLQFIANQGPSVPVSPDNNDVLFADGDLVTIDGPSRVFQEIAKILLTQQGADPIIPTYGSTVGAILATDFTADTPQDVANSVVEALSFLVAAETSTAADENIQSIQTLNVQQSQQDPREVDVSLIVTLQSGDTVEVSMGGQ